MAHFRHSIGLSATCINWGQWGEVGMATEVDFPGVRPVSTAQGLLGLEVALKSPNVTQIAAFQVESFSLLSRTFPEIRKYTYDQSLFDKEANQVSITSDEFWAEVDEASDREEKIYVFKKYIKKFVRNVLKMDPNEYIGDFADFQSLGVDSLMMLEMKNSIQGILGSRLVLTVSQLRDCNNSHLLSSRLVQLLEDKEDLDTLPTIPELRKLIMEDCDLPLDISVSDSEQVVDVSDIKTVLLTGATGNLGPYILRELCHNAPNISIIHCLVRKTEAQSSEERFKTSMKKRDMYSRIDMGKINVIQGDVSQAQIGLSNELYDELGETVDCVIHCAVISDHTAPYWKAPENRSSNARNVNVLGTKRILEFAAHKRVKHVFYASSIVVAATMDGDDSLSEDWQQTDVLRATEHNIGYLISKFIAEQLVKQGVERGIPCKALRFGFIAGDKVTGKTDVFTNHYMMRILAFLKLGVMPDSPIPAYLITPDLCAETLVHVCFNRNAESGAYNIATPNPQPEQICVEIAKGMGIQVKIVSSQEFLQRLRLEGDDSPISPLKRIYTEYEERMVEAATNISSLNHWFTGPNKENFFYSKKLSKIFPEFYEKAEPIEAIMRRDINFVKKSGAFEAIGIKLDY